LRRLSARQLLELDFPGYAVGGLAVGEPHEVTCEMAAEVTALLPTDRPRYLMGVGRPEQLADYVARGIDMMDCVLPTRAARHACLYTSEGRVLIKNARYFDDQRPIDPRCVCSVCQRYTRAYLRHLFAAGEITAAILATHHNVHFYLDTMRQIREAMTFGHLSVFAAELRARYAAGPA
jgi:queuine tRNA-ribosyltransferase